MLAALVMHCITFLGFFGLHFGSKNAGKISIVFEVLSRNSVFFRTKVKPYFFCFINIPILPPRPPPATCLPPSLCAASPTPSRPCPSPAWAGSSAPFPSIQPLWPFSTRALTICSRLRFMVGLRSRIFSFFGGIDGRWSDSTGLGFFFVVCQPTELIWAFCFINFPILPPPPQPILRTSLRLQSGFRSPLSSLWPSIAAFLCGWPDLLSCSLS